MRILVVDDYAPFANSVRLMLRDHQVELATGGREAIELLERDSGFDAMLVDLSMPGVSGLEVYEHLRTREPSACGRVIFITGGATEDASDALAALQNQSLEKPFREPELRALLARLPTP